MRFVVRWSNHARIVAWEAGFFGYLTVPCDEYAPVAQWIECWSSKPVMQVRFLPGAPSELCYYAVRSGYGLVVERVLAKDETRVRFSLSAPLKNSVKMPCQERSVVGEKAVYTGDKGHDMYEASPRNSK